MTKRRMLEGLGLAIALTTPLGLAAQEAAKPAKTPAARSAPAAPVDINVLLKAIPGDATGFIAVASLKQLDQHIQESAKALTLPPNTIPSLTEWVKGSLRVGEGFNENGSVAAVLLNTSKVTDPDQLDKRLVVLLPSGKPKELATSMGAKEEEGVLKLELVGAPAFAAAHGEFLAIAKDEAALKSLSEAKGEGLVKTLSTERQKVFAKQDVFGWVNLPAISKELRSSAQETIEKALGPVAQPMLQTNLKQLNDVLEQGKEFAFGVALSPKTGIILNFYSSMRPDTEMGKQMAAMKPATGSLLLGLPNDPFVVAGGVVTNPDMERQLKQVFDTVLSEEAVGEKVDKEKLGQIRDGLVRLISSVEQLSFGVYGLPVEDNQGLINVTLVARVKDSAQWKQDARKLFTVAKEAVTEAAKKEGESEEKVKQASDAIEWKENAEKLGGAEVDEVVLDLSKLPETNPEEVDQAKKVLGPEGATVRIGSLGKDKVAVVFGGGPKRFETTAKLAAANEAPLTANAGVKEVSGRLLQGPKLVEGFFAVDKFIDLVKDISNEVGGGAMIPISLQNAAPVALAAVKVNETATQTELIFPMELMKSVADVVRPMLMMGMGAQPGDSDEPEPPVDNSGLK